MAIKIIESFIKNFSDYGEKRSGELDSMELHGIGTAQNTGLVVKNNMNVSKPSGAVHYICDAEKSGTVYQLLPDDNTAWADAGYGNRHSITVELMESDYMRYTTGTANYTVTNDAKFKADIMRAYNTAVEFFAMKCKEYGWNPMDRLPNGLHRVYSHNEARAKGLASSHVDPDHVWSQLGLTMDGFRKAVLAEIGEEPTEMPIETTSEEDAFWNFLKKNGFSDVAASGIMGNIKAESAFKPKNMQDAYEGRLGFNDDTYTKSVDNGSYDGFVNDGVGYGFVQWTFWSRKQALLAYAKNTGRSIGNANMQREFFLAEIKNYTNVMKVLKNTDSIREASNAVLLNYEQPGDQSERVQNLRASYSMEYYNKYHTEEEKPTENVKYVVQCGLFSIKSNAETLKLRLEKGGFDALVKNEIAGFRVQAGVFGKKENAENLVKALKAKGFDAIIKETR